MDALAQFFGIFDVQFQMFGGDSVRQRADLFNQIVDQNDGAVILPAFARDIGAG